MPDTGTEPVRERRAVRAAALPPPLPDLAALVQAMNTMSVKMNTFRSDVCSALSRIEGIPTQIEDLSSRIAVLEARPEQKGPQDLDAKFADRESPGLRQGVADRRRWQ